MGVRGTRLFSLVLCVALLAGLPAAQAWAPEGFVDVREDLPQAVRDLLPTEETFCSGFYNAQTYYVLTEAANGMRTVYVLQPLAEGYAVDLRSAPLPPIDGVGASIGSTGRDYLYLFYESLGGSFNFVRQADGV